MDNAIRNALKRKRELYRELRKIDDFISAYEEFSGEKVIKDEMLSQSNENKEEQIVDNSPPKTVKRRNNIKKILQITAQLIRESGRPLTRGEVLNGLERMNVNVIAANKAKYLGTLLWRNKDVFISTDGDGYDLVERQTPPEPPWPQPKPQMPKLPEWPRE